VGDGQPFERYQCQHCGAHNPRRERPYCSVCGSRDLVPLPGPPLITRPEQSVRDRRESRRPGGDDVEQDVNACW